MKKLLRKLYLFNRDTKYFYPKEILFIAMLYTIVAITVDANGIWKSSGAFETIFRAAASLIMFAWTTKRVIGHLFNIIVLTAQNVHDSDGLKNFRKTLRNKIEANLDIEDDKEC